MYLIIYELENYELAMLVIFLPFLISSILTFRKFDIFTSENKNHVMLSKSNYNFWNIGFALLIALFCIKNLTIYTGILLLFALAFLFLEYTVSKRRVLTIDESGIVEFGKDKHRNINEITSINIYPNNVEFRFNENEILQINQNDLVQPEWNDFIERITKIKTYANNV
ncbi:hypothetical protein [Aequorivita sp. KMM 9714]|uniref:hypothetical protein n=1 Tax=Aequorivita sp. KMM 9714 TaxID=2707173 RepID=UPI0013EA7120|nr:hypothetical protein [Aequorivita sp. KMM 9714]